VLRGSIRLSAVGLLYGVGAACPAVSGAVRLWGGNRPTSGTVPLCGVVARCDKSESFLQQAARFAGFRATPKCG